LHVFAECQNESHYRNLLGQGDGDSTLETFGEGVSG
jgi:hypothetical protein